MILFVPLSTAVTNQVVPSQTNSTTEPITPDATKCTAGLSTKLPAPETSTDIPLIPLAAAESILTMCATEAT